MNSDSAALNYIVSLFRDIFVFQYMTILTRCRDRALIYDFLHKTADLIN